MATIDGQIAMRVRDYLGDTASQATYVTFSDATTVAQLITAVQTVQTDLNAITDGVIDLSEIKIVVPLTGGLRVTPVVGSTVENTAMFNFPVAVAPNRTWSSDVPAIAESKIVNGKVDLTDADILNWIHLFTVAGAVFTFVTEVFQALKTFLNKCVLTTRKHRKQLNRTSTEV